MKLLIVMLLLCLVVGSQAKWSVLRIWGDGFCSVDVIQMSWAGDDGPDGTPCQFTPVPCEQVAVGVPLFRTFDCEDTKPVLQNDLTAATVIIERDEHLSSDCSGEAFARYLTLIKTIRLFHLYLFFCMSEHQLHFIMVEYVL